MSPPAPAGFLRPAFLWGLGLCPLLGAHPLVAAEIARREDVRVYRASSADRLREIYRTLARSVGWESRPVEVTAIPAGLGAAAIIAALALSALMHPLGL